MEISGFGDGNAFHCDAGERRVDGADAAVKGCLQRGTGAAAISGAEWLRPPFGVAGEKHLRLRGGGEGQQPGEKRAVEPRQIAGDDEIPFRAGVDQRGEDAAERTLPGVEIREGRNMAERGLSGTDEGSATRSGGDRAADALGKGGGIEREQGFIPPHPGTAPAGQHVARVNHKEMITLGFCRQAHTRRFRYNLRENILRNFCFKLLIAGFAAGLLPAAGPEVGAHVTSVVHPDARTGKLVRSMVVSSKPVSEQRIVPAVVPARVASAPEPERVQAQPASAAMGIDAAVERIAAEHSLPPQLIHSVIKVESNYNPYAISSKGAQGLMQLIPATARRFGVTNAFNPVENIQGGAKYLRYLLDLYEENYPLALAAYNAGEAAVARYGGIPPFAETQNYVVLVRKQLEQAKRVGAVKAAAVPAPVVEAKESGPAHIVEVVQPDGSVRYVSK